LAEDELERILKEAVWPNWNTVPAFAGRDWQESRKPLDGRCPGRDSN